MVDAARGLGWYRAGAIAWIVFGAVHTLAIYRSYFGEPPDERYAALEQSLRDYIVPMGPFRPNALGTTHLLNESYSLLLLAFGAINLVAARPLEAAGRLRTGAIVNALLAGALLTNALAHQFPPPALFALVAAGLFAVCAVACGRGDQART